MDNTKKDKAEKKDKRKESSKEILKDIDLKKMIIYSELLKPKFED